MLVIFLLQHIEIKLDQVPAQNHIRVTCRHAVVQRMQNRHFIRQPYQFNRIRRSRRARAMLFNQQHTTLL